MLHHLLLHVGAMKSGTTYLQSLLFANKAAFDARGVLVPGASRSEQGRGVRDVLGHADRNGVTTAGAWDPLVRQVQEHDGTAVISVELLGPAVPRNIEKVLEPFDDVRVVVTARDLNRNLVAMWQETLQNGRTWTLPEFVEGARRWRPRAGRSPEDRTEAGTLFWRQQNLVRICRNWSVASSGVTVVTVPHPGSPRETLRDRFVEVLGVESDGLQEGPQANESLGASSAETLRRLNLLLDERGLPFAESQALRKYVLAKRLLAAHRPEEPAIGLPVEPWVVEQTERIVSGLQSLDVDVVGDLADLEPVAVPGRSGGQVDEAEVLDAALAGLAGMVEEYAGS